MTFKLSPYSEMFKLWECEEENSSRFRCLSFSSHKEAYMLIEVKPSSNVTPQT